MIFRRPETYDIDPKKLELNFKNLQKMIHPDLFSTKSEVGLGAEGDGKEEKAVSASVSSTLNIAHNKLKNPITRAAYLVGVSVPTNGKVKLLTGTDVLGEDENFKVPMELLMEVMEIREQLSSAKSKEEKDALRQQVDASFKKHENAFRCSLCKSPCRVWQ